MSGAWRALGVAGSLLLRAGLVVAWVWACLAIALAAVPWGYGAPAALIGAAAGLGLYTLATRDDGRWRGPVVWAMGCLVLATWIGFRAHAPRTDRDWRPELARAASFEHDLGGDALVVRHVRDFTWRSMDDYQPRWVTRRYDLAALRRVWFYIEPHHAGPWVAHTSVGFEFAGSNPGGPDVLVLSVEARKEVGEPYDPAAGMYKAYELTYVAATERDALSLQVLHRDHTLYAFPVRADRADVRAMLLDMARRGERLRGDPTFYHTLWANCTTTLLDHANAVADRPIPYGLRVLLPALSGRLLHQLGLLDRERSYEALARRWDVTEAVRDAAAAGLEGRAFSAAIRAGRESPTSPR